MPVIKDKMVAAHRLYHEGKFRFYQIPWRKKPTSSPSNTFLIVVRELIECGKMGVAYNGAALKCPGGSLFAR